jgi:hypothetical protein
MGINSRQIVQAKAAYTHITQAMEWASSTIAPEPDITVRWNRCKDSLVYEGYYTLTEASCPGANPHTVEITPQRFFRYADRTWIYRCNVYQPIFKLCTMAAAREDYKAYYKNPDFWGAARVVRGVDGVCNENCF